MGCFVLFSRIPLKNKLLATGYPKKSIWAALFYSLRFHLKTNCWPRDAQKRVSADMVDILQETALVGGLKSFNVGFGITLKTTFNC